MSLNLYLAFVAACIALALLPRPVVTLVIANGLRHGTRAALTNILGVQAGLAIVIGIVAVGLTSLMATMGYWFDWVRFAGAAYLVWLGIKLIRSPVEAVNADAPPPPPRGGFFLQGFLVLLSNPKVLVFFGAFIPQFMDMSRDHFSQVALLGVTFMITGAITDSIYALLAGRARRFFSERRTRALSRVAGGFMIGGRIWLTLTPAPQLRGVGGVGERFDDGRRPLASAGRGAVILGRRYSSPCARSAISISPKIRASRSAHCRWPAGSAIKSWRISMPVFIRPRASP